jgi:3,4-dihydroxy 2-butanone 4-phosphate synthase / GTP cyclohydrolase II
MVSAYGFPFRLIVYRNKLDGAEIAAFVTGNILPDRPTLVRVHRVEFPADILGEPVERSGLIPRALREIGTEPDGGVMVVLRDSRPDAMSRRFKDEEEHDHEKRAHMLREYGLGAQILRDLGVRRMVLLSNAPQKIVGLEGYGLSVDGWRPFKPLGAV